MESNEETATAIVALLLVKTKYDKKDKKIHVGNPWVGIKEILISFLQSLLRCIEF